MKQILTNLAVVVMMLVGFSIALVIAQPVASGAALGASQSAVCDAIGSPNCGTNTNGGTDVNKVITTVINLFSIVVGIVAVIMIITAGFKYVTSSGDAAKVTSAKNTLVYSIVGLVIVALAQSIVKFVLHKVTQ